METSQPQEETLFAEASQMLDPEQRRAYLDRQCSGNAVLRQRLETLLEGASLAERFFSEGAAALEAARAASSVPGEKPGDRISHYKLLEKLGEGGCGVVYMAEQEQPVRRRVALKVIKLGMDTRRVIARFEAERQALALMDHPNIAKVLDAGATETGRPFFVMELVRGVRLTDYCDQNQIPTTERLRLFMQVSQAVQHAHQKGIIHRDLKPSNILVTINDGVAVPKVIDFGIAKATEGRLTDKTVFTSFAQFLGTPAYMSPEQAVLTSVDIDTRSDIYSLGVLLYELLTGRTPFDTQELMRLGWEALSRTICEQEPPRPSTRLSTLQGEALAATARQHQTEPLKLVHLITGDLDWIVMKCLEKDRARRYQTANALAADILRHLENEPVAARPPSRLYRFQKLVQRNRLMFAAVSAVMLALLLGMVASSYLLVREMRERQRASANEQKAKQVAQLLKDMLNGAGPSVALGRDTTLLREIVDTTAEHAEKALGTQADVQAELLNTIGEVYEALGQYRKSAEMHGKAIGLLKQHAVAQAGLVSSLTGLGRALRELGKLAQAEAVLRQALAAEQQLRRQPERQMVATLAELGRLLRDTGRLPEAESVLQQALAVQAKVDGGDNPQVRFFLATVLRGRGKAALAERYFRDALAGLRKVQGGESPEIAECLTGLGGVLEDQGRLAEAEGTLREALTHQKRLMGPEHPEVGKTINLFGEVLLKQGKLPEAEAMLRESVDTTTRLHRDQQPGMADALNCLALILSEEAKLAEAAEKYEAALALLRKLHGNEHPDIATALHNLAGLRERQGKPREAEILERQALDMRKKLQGSNHPDVPTYTQSLAIDVCEQGKLPEAEQILREALALHRTLKGSSHLEVGECLLDLARVLMEQRKTAEAAQADTEALAILRNDPGNHSLEIAQALNDLGQTLMAQQRVTEAEERFRSALKEFSDVDKEHPQMSILKVNLSQALLDRGQVAEAEVMARQALASIRNKLGGEHPLVVFGLWGLGKVLLREGKLAEAETTWGEALELKRKPLVKEHPETATALDYLGRVYARQGRLAQAESTQRQVLAMRRNLMGEQNPDVLISLRNVASVLRQENKLQESESFSRQALAMAYVVWTNNPRNWAPYVDQSCDVLLSQEKFEEAARLVEQILTPAIQSETKPGGLLKIRGAYYARTGHWREAIADFSQAVQSDPDDEEAYPGLICLLGYSGNRGRAEEVFHLALKHFKNTSDPFSAGALARVGLLFSLTDSETEAVERWVALGLSIDESHDHYPRFCIVKALCEYRHHRFGSAQEWLQKAGNNRLQAPWQAEAEALLAMARHGLEGSQEPDAKFLATISSLQGPAMLGDSDLGPNWGDVLVLRTLLREFTATGPHSATLAR